LQPHLQEVSFVRSGPDTILSRANCSLLPLRLSSHSLYVSQILQRLVRPRMDSPPYGAVEYRMR
jgi:hypothetical protein